MADDASEAPPPAAKPKARKAHCAKCGGQRNCEIHGRYTENFSDDDFWGQTTWFLLQCRGCDEVFAQRVSIDSESLDFFQDRDGSQRMEYAESVTYWPALSARKRPEWMTRHGFEGLHADFPSDQVRHDLSGALEELYGALDNNLSMLAAVGIRTCFDLAAQALGVDSGMPFDQKLRKLVDTGRIKPVERDRLQTAVEAGSASIHRGWKPSTDDLHTMATILEEFLFDAFVRPAQLRKLDAAAAKVQQTVPRRGTKGGGTKDDPKTPFDPDQGQESDGPDQPLK